MADNFQSQPKCPNCLDTGIETRYKGDPTLETDHLCECGVMSKAEYMKQIDDIAASWGKDDVFTTLGLMDVKAGLLAIDKAFIKLKNSRDAH